MPEIVDKIRRTLRDEGALSLARKAARLLADGCKDLAIPLAILRIRMLGDTPLEDCVDFAASRFRGLIVPQQQREEFLDVLHLLAERRPRTVLEIGTATGGGLFCFTRVASDDALLVSVDLPSGYRRYRTPLYRAFARGRQRIHLVRADSHDARTLSTVSRMLGDRPLDFLFIDGDHTYEGVKRDFEMYGPLVTEGGVIGFHDINLGDHLFGGGSKAFWREIRDRYRSMEFIRDPSVEQFGTGLLIGPKI
jgi:predicted O-methyltransferase YrrM